MRILMPVSFVAEEGGLHDHVEEIALAMRQFGHSIVVAGRPGQFLDRLSDNQIETLPVDFDALEVTMGTIASAGPWDLVHTHPFQSRAFSVLAARTWKVPLVVTIHGWYLDDLPTWHRTANAIIAVTDAISDRIKQVPGMDPAKVHQISNHLRITGTRGKLDPNQPHILSVASRVDRDFAPVLTLLDEFVEELIEHEDNGWEIQIAGSGTGVPQLIKHISTRWSREFCPRVSLLGWLRGQDLADLYARSFATIAPGRSAIDAIGFGIPTVLTRQIGTYALSPIGDSSALLNGTVGESVSGQDLYSACKTLSNEPDLAYSISEAHRRIARLHFDPLTLSRQLAVVYETAALDHASYR